MLISCNKCGKVHDRKFICQGKKRTYKKRIDMAVKFRNTQAWRNKRREIVNRDRALCQLCIRNMYELFHTKILNQDVQVHHIIPINEDYERRLDNENLICLCTYHHHMAEHDQVDRQTLIELARVQEGKEHN